MSKILVGDLKELAKQADDINVIKIGDFSIEVKQYIDYLDKINLASTVYGASINVEDNLQVMDYNIFDMIYKVLIVKEYSNISLPQTTNEDGSKSTNYILAYDLLMQSGLYEKIYNAIPEQERREMNETLRSYEIKKKERYERENTLPNIVKNMLNELVGKLPTADEAKKFIEDASKELNNLNPDNLKFVQDFLKVNRGENIG